MTGLLEFGARAALCRQLARREPDSEILWLAEAERWSRLTVTGCRGQDTPVGDRRHEGCVRSAPGRDVPRGCQSQLNLMD
jgi:hypothetical protein